MPTAKLPNVDANVVAVAVVAVDADDAGAAQAELMNFLTFRVAVFGLPMRSPATKLSVTL